MEKSKYVISFLTKKLTRLEFIDKDEDYGYAKNVDGSGPQQLVSERSNCPNNGLVCFSTISRDPIYICNPVTKEYVYLPAVSSAKSYSINCGFGYHNSLDEYKVVRIYSELFTYRAQVYTLGSGHGRKDTRTFEYSKKKRKIQFLKGPGICASGALHWLHSWETEIVAFDLADEEFRWIPLPPLSPEKIVSKFYLKLLSGHLCVVRIDVGEKDKFIHIWALQKKKKFGSYETKLHEFIDSLSWSKKFCFSCTKDVAYMPFAVTKSNQVLMSDGESVFCYDFSEIAIKKLWNGSPRSGIQAIPHVNSLV
ncbi:F-box/kelch-repeat protein At3g06240-like [Papaver somniferum]|uniref:F-box/kelch-repeat protein At3g06240-like n=1 Tax=Papaver somniferum TaxID=3469 RepID=UPI000E6FC126|nr:F-box/kelch-repeat protein At3g06240-like [Papaver somniferum]